jgi:hypothetical protein
MDETSAKQALDTADSMASKVRGQGRWHPKAMLGLGVLEAAIVLAGGLFPNAGLLLMPGALLPLFAYVIYTATRPVVARRQRYFYPILGALVAVVIAIAGPLGQVNFPQNPAWWVPAAVLSAIPFVLAAWLEVRGRR